MKALRWRKEEEEGKKEKEEGNEGRKEHLYGVGD